MPIPLDCPGCNSHLELPDALAGKRIRCKQCNWKLNVPEPGEEAAPAPGRKPKSLGGLLDDFDREKRNSERARPGRREADFEDDDEYEEKAARKSPVPWIVGGGVLVVVLVGVGAFFAFRGGDDKDAKPDALVQNDPRPPRPVIPNVRPVTPVTPRPPRPNPNPVIPRNNPRPVKPPEFPQERPVAGPANPLVPPAPKVEETEEDRAAAVAWAVKPDPAAEKVELPEAMRTPIPVPTNSDNVLFPTTPSRFVALGRGSSPRDSTLLWDLQTNKGAGLVRGKTDLREPMAVPPGGKYLAGQSGFTGRTVDVYSFENSRPVRRFDLEGTGRVTWVDFGTTSDQLYILYDQSREKTLQLWEIESGKNVKNVTLPKDLDPKSLTISPGRNYLAGATKEYVYLYKLPEGTLAGTQRLPRPANNFFKYDCKGLAFSPDGTELAALLYHGLGKEHVLLTWDVAKGEQTHAHDISDGGQGISWYKGPAVEYLPDGKALLVDGKLVVEHDSGLVLTRLTVGELDSSPHRRVILPNDTILVLTNLRGPWRLQPVAFARDAYEKAVAAAREAGPNELPAPKPADVSAVRTVRVASPPAWGVKPEPLNPPSLAESTPLANPGKDVRSVHFAGPEAGQAATLSVTEQAVPFVRQVLRCDRYDVAGRKHLGGFEVPAKVKEIKKEWRPVAGLSPGGERFAVVSPDEPQRVDLFSAADGQHLGGFLPYQKEVSAVKWLSLVGDDRLLTLGENGRLTLWEVPAFKAVYESGESVLAAEASPSREWVAALHGSSLDLIEAATGETRGRVALPVPLPARGAGVKLAFRPDGQELAAVIPGGADQTVLRWDLRGGELADEFKTEVVMPDGLHYCDAEHLLAGDGTLIDFAQKAVVWTYRSQTGNTRAKDSPDGNHWYVAQGPNNAGAGLLVSEPLPDGRVAAMLAEASQPGVEKLLAPGEPVAIRLSLNPPHDPDAYKKDLTHRLADSLKAHGLTVSDQARVGLVVEATQGDSGEQAEVTRGRGGPFGMPRPPIGPFGGRPRMPGEQVIQTINLPKVDVTVSLVAADGQTLWSQKHTAAHGRFFSRALRDGEDPTQVVTKDVWNYAASWVATVNKPRVIYRKGGQLLLLPGSSTLSVR